MDVKAINNVSLQQSFEGKPRKTENKGTNEYPQMDAPLSKNGAKAMRDLIAGLMLLGATAGATSGLTSCVKAEAWAEADADAKAWAWVINNNNGKPDTIFVTTPIQDINFAINDSIIHQFLNIGSEIDGPLPDDDKNILLVSGTFRNRYDNKVVKFQADSCGTNREQSTFISEVTDLYDPKNPKKTWVKTVAKDVPGRGIKYEFYTTTATKKPEPWQYNQQYSLIVSNGARSNKPGVNTIYDKDGNMIWQGQLTRGQKTGAFMYGTLALDENGEIYRDPETGEPELINYDFDNTKIWTRKVDWKEQPKKVKVQNFDYDL